MKRFDTIVLGVLLSGVCICTSPESFATDDVNKAVESLAKLYKADKLFNETLFSSFVATDSRANFSSKYAYDSKQSESYGFKIKGLKSLQYKIDPNQILYLKNGSLNYLFVIQF